MSYRTSDLVRGLGVVALAASTVVAAPQAGAPTGAAESTAGVAPPISVDNVTGLELESPRDGYSYKPENRRDPFVDLRRQISATEKGVRPQGIAGLMINEVALKGIVKNGDQGYIALLLGPGDKTWFCKLGQRLYDGAITAIDAATVTFRQEVTDPLAPVKTREVKKFLYPSEEARQ
jgi:hypothetical protein